MIWQSLLQKRLEIEEQGKALKKERVMTQESLFWGVRSLNSKVLKLICLTVIFLFNSCTNTDWRTATRESAGISPDPATTKEAVLHVYGADAWGWRGWFAIHTWIAAKKTGETAYTVYDVVGWRGYHGQSVLRISRDVPDRYWYGEKPRLLIAHQGEGVDELIMAVDIAARAYPWEKTYKAFPGPNSNTFTAWVAEQVPELQLELPFSAIGKGYVD